MLNKVLSAIFSSTTWFIAVYRVSQVSQKFRSSPFEMAGVYCPARQFSILHWLSIFKPPCLMVKYVFHNYLGKL